MALTDIDVVKDQYNDNLPKGPAPVFMPEQLHDTNPSTGGDTRPSFLSLTPNVSSDDKVYANTPTFYNPKNIPTKYDRFLLGKDNEAINADIQSGWDRAGNAGANLVEKIGAYTVQTAGFIGGAVGATVGGTLNLANELVGGDGKLVKDGKAVSMMTDNFLTNLGDLWKEHVQETNPIYKSKAYTEGNVWNKLLTSSWWLDDAIDRVALTGAMLIPGFAEAKGVGLFGVAMEEGGLIRATGMGTKAIQALAENPEIYGKVGRFLGSNIYKAAAEGVADVEASSALQFKNLVQAAQRAELYTWNVIGQSGLNGREAQVGIRKALQEQKAAGLIDLTDDQIEQKAALGAAKGFWYTMPLSLLASIVELPQVFSTAKTGESLLKKYFNVSTLEKFSEEVVNSTPTIKKLLGKTLLTGLEHGQNESAQVAVGRYLEESIAGKIHGTKVETDEGSPMISMFKNWLDNVHDPNGQNNIALGTIQGMLMTLFGHGHKMATGQYAKQDTATNNFIKAIDESVANRRYYFSPQDLVEKDDKGQTKLHPDGSPVFNQERLAELGGSILNTYTKGLERQQAIKTNNTAAIERLNFEALAALSHNFFEDSYGMEYLTNLLKFEAKNQKQEIARVNDSENGTEITPSLQLSKNLETVNKLKQAYDAVENRYAGFIKLDYDHNDQAESQLASIFSAKQKYAQYNNAAQQLHLNNLLDRNSKELSQLGILEKVEDPKTPQEIRANFLIDQNEMAQKALDEEQTTYKDLINPQTYKDAFKIKLDELNKTKQKIEETKKNGGAAPIEEAKSITVSTKNGDYNLETGKEYYAGSKLIEAKEGDTVIEKFSRFKVLGETSDGKAVKVQLPSGNTINLDKSALAQYAIGSVENTDKIANAKFYIDTTDHIFTYQLKGQDNKVGRLTYDPDTDRLRFESLDGKFKTYVTRDQFQTKEGYNKAQIFSDKKFTPKAEEALKEAVPASEQDAKKTERLRIISQMFDEVTTRINATDSLINAKKNELDNITKKLQETEDKIAKTDLKKSGNFKKMTVDAIQSARKLSRMADQLRNEITKLESEKDQLEYNQAFIADLAQNMDQTIDGQEFMAELKDHQNDISDLIINTGLQINALSKVLDNTEASLNDAIDQMMGLIREFEKTYPKAPTAMLGQAWIDFLKANPNFLKLNENFKEDLAEVESIVADMEDNYIKPDEQKIKELKDSLEKLQEELTAYEKELQAGKVILDRFEDIAKAYKQMKVEEKKLNNDKNLIAAFIGTMTNRTPNIHEENKTYEFSAKKSDLQVVGGTIAINTGKAHQKRANAFGFRFQTLQNKDDIRGVIVNSTTEDSLIPGLTKHLFPDNAEDVIALVMVNKQGQLVDEFGKVIPETTTADEKINSAIYQVFPSAKLELKYKKSPQDRTGTKETMFREDTPENVQLALKEQYGKWRQAELDRKVLGSLQDIDASFGAPEYVTKLNDKGEEVRDDDARTSVEDAGLINKKQLKRTKLITVALTNEKVSNGSVTFTTPLGRVFLEVPGGMVKLFNNKVGDVRAANLFEVIKQLASNGLKPDGIKSEQSKRLLNWLDSVVYWGIPKDEKQNRIPAGYNSVWFEQVMEDNKPVSKLFISGKSTTGFPFTPTGMEENREAITTLLANIYTNTNATLANNKKFAASYSEIIGLDENGDPITKKWDNYQTYLLSGEGRTADEIPLTTKMRPKKNAEDINRNNIYFTLTDTADNYVIPQTIEKKVTSTAKVPVVDKKADIEKRRQEAINQATTQNSHWSTPLITTDKNSKTPIKITWWSKEDMINDINSGKYDAELSELTKQQPSTQAQAALAQQAPAAVFVLDGTTNNTISIGTFGTTTFKLNAEEYIKTNGEKGFTPTFDGALVQALMDAKGYDSEKAQQVIGASIIAKVQPLLDAIAIPVEPAIDPIPQTEQDEWNTAVPNAPDDTAYRIKLVDEVAQFEKENWDKVDEFLKVALPNVPMFRVKNLIQATNGRQAFGMFQKGAMYVYENAEVGTVYHEVFEAVWHMFASPEEKTGVIDEFKGREGSFTDRETGNTVKYSEATAQQIKEQLAEEYRDYVHEGKVPPKAGKGQQSLIARIFSSISDFIKKMFNSEDGPSNVEDLFKNISNGYYSKFNPYESRLQLAQPGVIDIDNVRADVNAQYRITKIPSQQVHEIMQQMTYSTIIDLIKTNESLFNIPTLNKKELHARLYDEVRNLIRWQGSLIEQAVGKGELSAKEAAATISNLKTLWKNVELEWEGLTQKHEELLRSYDVTFDDAHNGILNAEDKTGRADWQDARKIDDFRKAHGAIKLLFGTIAEVTKDAAGNTIIDRSSIGGATLFPGDKAWITLKNKLYNSVDVKDMLEKLRQEALKNPIYEALYERITKQSYKIEGVNLDKLTQTHDAQLLSAFWGSMKSLNPDVKTIFIQPTGEPVVGDSNLSSAAKQAKSEMFETLIDNIKSKTTGYVGYNDVAKTYSAAAAIDKVKLDPSRLKTYTDFLDKLGIKFNVNNLNKLSNEQRKLFRTAVEGLRKSISEIDGVVSLNKKTVSADARLLELGLVKAMIENPDYQSTYFNLNGDRVQTYIGTNLIGNFNAILSKVKNITDLAVTQFNYLATDVFSKGSHILDQLFDSEDGERLNSGDLMNIAYADGTVNEINGKKKESSKLNKIERLIQEINLNAEGYFLNLVPGDASIEWMVKLGQAITEEGLLEGDGDIHSIFAKYFKSEINLSRDKRAVIKGSKELRFFKAILSKETYAEIMSKDNSKLTAEEIYDKYENTINREVSKFIDKEAKETKTDLERYGAIKYTEDGIETEGLPFAEDITKDDLKRNMKAIAANYIIGNIELHKLIYSDPYQYKDELKRIKTFNSPKESIASDPEFNAILDKVYNKNFEEGTIGHYDFLKPNYTTVTIKDIFTTSDLADYGVFEETDGGGYISMAANRDFRLRAGRWNDLQEKQYAFDVAYEKAVKSGADKETLTKLLRTNPGVMSAYTPLKPAAAGNKDNGKNFNDVVVDKFALVPLSFFVLHTMNPESNAIKFYNKMQEESIDYAVYGTGRKVGAEAQNDLYVDGSINSAPFVGIINVPHSIIGVQSEVPSKENAKSTQGSQITQLATMDFLEAGIPVDFLPGEKFGERLAKWDKIEDKEAASELYKEIKLNEKLLVARLDDGFKTLTNDLGITEVKKGFKLSDPQKLIDTLKNEILKRQVNDNILDTFEEYSKGGIILEATPAYQQIRNILYSIADRELTSTKIKGGMKVQAPATMFESKRIKLDTIDGKDVYSSSDLKFYVNDKGQRVCEVYVGRWFKSNKSDAELIKELNESDVLNGIGFRIPTQNKNSIEVFKIAGFLPKEFGDTVIVPSELVKKAGSDFDIDKLSLYLKNVYEDNAGNIQSIPYYGIGEEAKTKLKEQFLKNDLESIFDIDFSKRYNYLDEDQDIAQAEEDNYDKLYRQSLDNEYVRSLERLTSHEANFKGLTKPNSADDLKELSNNIVNLLGEETYDYSSESAVKNMLSRRFMSQLRHDFVTGKYTIGIAATAQTNHAKNQRSLITIDPDRLAQVNNVDKHFLGDAKIKFEKFNQIDGKATLSMITNADGQNISDIIAQFIDGYVDISKGPWIMQLGATPNVAGTWLFLAKIGVPINSIAYFMNQPIVRNYLSSIETAGYSYLFMDKFVNDMMDIYDGEDIKITTLPNEAGLKKMVGKSLYAEESKKKLDDTEKAQQRFILTEFLKYAKMAEHLFMIQQATNFDTANFNDPFLIFKKNIQLERANNNTIISQADLILQSSFLGDLVKKLNNVRNAFAQILLSDRDTEGANSSPRRVMEAVLTDYIDVNDRDFIKISQKAVNDMFDWAVQTDRNINKSVAQVLLGTKTKTSVAKQIVAFADKVKADVNHPLYKNVIINNIKLKSNDKEGKADNLYIAGLENKIYDQNQIIYGFRELKNKIEDKALYGNLVRLAVIQSGLSNSPISFTNLLPIEDFEEVYAATLSKLENMDNLDDFYKLGVFQRNNWNNSDIVPFMKAPWIKTKKGKLKYDLNSSFFLPKELRTAMGDGKIPKVVSLSTYSREARSEYMTYSWEEGTKATKAAMRKKGDYSFIKKVLMKKVRDDAGNPLITTSKTEDNVTYKNYIYKAINAWGDGFRANEFYGKLKPTDSNSTIAEPSKLDNGYNKVEEKNEVEKVLTIDIIHKFAGEVEDDAIVKLVPETKKDIFTC